MNLSQILLVLRAHYKIAVFVAICTVAITMVVSVLLPKQYVATTSVLVDAKSPDPLVAILMPPSVGTQVDIINSDRVALKVVRTLRLNESVAAREQWLAATGGRGSMELWLAQLLQKGLIVTPSRDSNVVNLAYRGADPDFTAAVANAFAQAYIDVAIELKIDPARQYARWFGDQGKALRDNLEKAQAQLSAYQKDKGIVASDERMDTETARLGELSSQLTRVQDQINDARSKQNSGAQNALPEVVGSSVIANLRSDIGRQEAKLQEVGVNLGTNHPTYQRMQSEVAALRQKLQNEIKLVTSGFTATRNVSADKEGELRAAIAEQKKKLLDLKTQRDELAVLQRDVDAARSAYDGVTKRYNENALASQATQTTVFVLTPAVAPLAPAFPKSLDKMAMIGVALGIGLGIAVAFLIEMLDRRIRSRDDLIEAVPFPLLGVIERAKKRPRLTFWQRTPALALK